MYKILLVDDDYLVLEFLKTMIPWENLGFEVVGLCEDGEQALTLVNEKEPDVIMTDIGMPRKDGISLITEVKQKNAQIKSIFLTCYDDFKYAQQAIRLNSFDYILKETIEPESIIEMVTKLKAELDNEERKEKVLSNMKGLIKENLTILRSKLLERLLQGNPEDIIDWLTLHEDELELDFSAFKNCLPILCFIDDYEELVGGNYSDGSLKFSIDSVITNTLSHSSKGFCLFYKEDMFFILYSSNQFVSEEQIYRVLRDIQTNLRTALNTSITAIIGDSCAFPNDLTAELNEMIESVDQRFYLESGSISEKKQTIFSTENLFTSYVDMTQTVKSFIIKEDEDGLKKWVIHLTTLFVEKKYNPKIVKKFVLSILFEVEKMIHSMQRLESEVTEPFVDESIHEAKTAEQLAQWLMDSLNEGLRRMVVINNQPKREEIIKAQKYVLLNLDKKVTLNHVATHLHLNPSYFSRLFKQHTNINFIDYVNQTKVERAKELIDNTNETIEKIADRLGFESRSYFLKVFKKYCDASPIEYKQGARVK